VKLHEKPLIKQLQKKKLKKEEKDASGMTLKLSEDQKENFMNSPSLKFDDELE